MTRVLKTGLVLAMVFGVVWLAVIIWWQESHTLPTGVDIGLYLFALPLALIAAGWAGKRIVRARREARANPTPAATDGDGQTAAATPATARLIVLASTARAALGNDPASIHAAVAEQQRPALDASLINAKGFPIFAARAAHLDTELLRDAAAGQQAPKVALAEDIVRATALLGDVVQTLSQDARARVLDSGTPERDDAWPLLQLELALPVQWPEAARDHACKQARAAAVWPDSRLGMRPHAAKNALDSDSLLRQLALEPLAPAIATLRLVAAADSYIDANRVQDWEQQGALAGNATPQGRIPGEAAAGVLVDLALGRQDAGTPVAPPEGAMTLTLSATAQRATAADARGAINEPMLAALATQFLEQHAQPADAIAALVSDADHRGSRPLEAAGLASTLFPKLDPNQDCLAVGAACGYTGAASHLLTLVVANEACAQMEGPVLVVLTQDPALRACALVAPALSPSA
ncbi:hypothetical protein [Achromobacter sp.]|uniref:hypothetical protein n=1 Tax=Achromobacter sp. TaxID=134375 RepID=UPI000EC536A5|nr:hypothetical protein [Achromobacter sp.]HCW21507.1 hypothetical protein [Achromobacter sp.]